MELLMPAAETYDMLRQFPAALKLLDRALDITPNDPDVIAAKAGVYQSQGDLQEAARLLSGINEKTSDNSSVVDKITQLRLERKHVRPFDCCKPDWLNSILILSSTRASSRSTWLSLNPCWR